MSKPIITKIEQKGYVDGSVVYENDARISSEIEGNVELSDVSEPKSSYNITVGPVYFGPEKGSADLASDWETTSATILVFRVERPMEVTGLQATVGEILLDSDNSFHILLEYSETSMLGAFGPDDVATPGLPASGDWKLVGTSASPEDPAIYGIEAGGRYGAEGTAGAFSGAREYRSGTFVRVRLMPVPQTLPDLARPQAMVTVTLTVAEEHVE